MFFGDRLAREASSIAREFHTVRDLGDREQYLKAAIKVVRQQDHRRFFAAVSSGVRKYGAIGVVVLFRGTEGRHFTTGRLFLSFVHSLRHRWASEARISLEEVARSQGALQLRRPEILQLLNECVELTRAAVGCPVIVLFHLDRVPYTLSALRFLLELRNLAPGSSFPWLITSSSAHLPLFMGYNHTASQASIHQDVWKLIARTETNISPMFAYDVATKCRTVGKILAVGPRPECELELKVRHPQDAFALYPSAEDRAVWLLGFSVDRKFSLFHQRHMIPFREDQGQSHLPIRWPDLDLKLDLDQFRGDEPVSIYALVSRPIKGTIKPNPPLSIPARSVVRLRAYGESTSRDFIIAVP